MDYRSWFIKLDDLLFQRCEAALYELQTAEWEEIYEKGLSPEEALDEYLERYYPEFKQRKDL